MFALSYLSISVQLGKKLFGIINKRGWGFIQAFERLEKNSKTNKRWGNTYLALKSNDNKTRA